MPRTSLTELEKRIRALRIGVQMQVKCNRGLILIVEKQLEHDNLTLGGQYHAWIEPSNPDGTETNFTGQLEGLMALIAVQRKRVSRQAYLQCSKCKHTEKANPNESPEQTAKRLGWIETTIKTAAGEETIYTCPKCLKNLAFYP